MPRMDGRREPREPEDVVGSEDDGRQALGEAVLELTATRRSEELTDVERHALDEALAKLTISRQALTEALSKIPDGGPERTFRVKFGGDEDEAPAEALPETIDRRARLQARLERCVGELRAATSADEQRLIWEEINDLCFLALGKSIQPLPALPAP